MRNRNVICWNLIWPNTVATTRDSIGAAAPDARIISTATVLNTPSWPKKVPTILVASLAMLVLFSPFVLTGELLRALPQDDPVLTGREIPVPAAARRAPVAAGADPLAVAEATGRKRTESGRDGAEELAHALSGAGESGRLVTVLGPIPDTLTTPTAIALARRLAQAKRVVLVELTPQTSGLSAIASDLCLP